MSYETKAPYGMPSSLATPQATIAEELLALMRNELDTLKALLQTIDDEHASLLASDLEQLEAATQKKTAAIAMHQSQQGTRLRWMQSQGLTPDLSFSDLLSRLEPSELLQKTQSELAALATECQESNRRNGGLIGRLQEHAQGALGALRGNAAEAKLYSLSGAKERDSDGRSLGTA